MYAILKNNFNPAKQRIESLLGKHISFRDKDARYWFRNRKNYEGTIKSVYPHHFLVEITGGNGDIYRESFAYVDVLTGHCRILNEKG